MTDPTTDPDAVTIGMAARRAGVTVRTLHHWDHIGLASPSGRSHAGYRLYSATDQDQLHRIVAYQRAGLSLDAIRELLERPGDQIRPALAEQRRLLADRIDELHALDAHLERIETAHQQGILLNPADQTAVFGPTWDPANTETARQRWGGTLQWAQFAERSATRSRHEWAGLAAQMRHLEHELATALHDGVPSDGPTAMELVERHRELFSQFFPLSREMQVCLGRMFATDPGFASHYNHLHPGLAHWLHHAINHSATAHGINPDDAAWR